MKRRRMRLAGLVLAGLGSAPGWTVFAQQMAQSPQAPPVSKIDGVWPGHPYPTGAPQAGHPGSEPPTGQITPTPPGTAPGMAPGAPPSEGMAPAQPGMAPGEFAPPEAGAEAAAPTPALDAAAAAGAANVAGLGGGLAGSGAGALVMLGDAPPLNTRVRLQATPAPNPPPIPDPGVPPFPNDPGEQPLPAPFTRTTSTSFVPSVRGFKLSENQSPQPQDRIYFSFNYYDDVNNAINRRLGSPIYDIQVYRYFFGFEKTFWDGQASIQMRLPIDNMTAKSYINGFQGTNTAVGDLATIFKYAFLWDRDTGNLLSGGMLVSAPTGPQTFAGFPNLTSPHSAAIQPFLGFLYNYGDWYFQGFSSIDVPFSRTADVSVWFNDLGVGYFLYRDTTPDALITMIAPTFEVHANTPINHSDPFNATDIAGTPQLTNLTFGLNVGVGQHGLFSVGYVNPITGPRAFNGELLAIFNLRY